MTIQILVCVVGIWISGVVLAQQEPSMAQQPVSCPAEQMDPPRYPLSAAKAGKTGKVIVSVAFDACGRVTDAKVAKSSKSSVLDEAALAAASHWILGMPTSNWTLVNGRLESPVEFSQGELKLRSPKQLGWPQTHKHPRYILDTVPSQYDSAIDARQAVNSSSNDRIGVSPYRNMSGIFLAAGTVFAPEFWLFPYPDKVAVRYQPIMENEEPVVRLLILCDEPKEICAKDEALFMQGLPFAKPKRS